MNNLHKIFELYLETAAKKEQPHDAVAINEFLMPILSKYIN